MQEIKTLLFQIRHSEKMTQILIPMNMPVREMGYPLDPVLLAILAIEIAGSRAPAAQPRFGNSGSSGDGGDTGSFDDEEIDPEGTFSSGGGYGGDFQGSSSNHYGSGGGYGYADDETGGFGGIKTPAEKKKEELKQLKASIGGKHENIFEKASKILSAYCMEGPLKCE